MNNSYYDFESIVQLSEDQNTKGFDLRAGQSWIYPTNYPIRDYQFNITQAALFKNTLVSLPTGLGKTFIAAVVMYNFYRWYPLGKIIFMAPTKPLVKQQQDACYNIMAIPSEVTAEMTGANLKVSRKKIWENNRVFFITPHILQNDIDIVLDLAQDIKCIVIDEAHKAHGKNANCEAVKKIYDVNKNFRILALTATAGSNFNSVREVLNNLLISHIEVRTNESLDVAPYVFQRKLDTFVIPITGKLLKVKMSYIKILDAYIRPLVQGNIISGDCANLTKGRLVMTMKDFKEKGRQHSNYGHILKSLNICVTLYHGYELLIHHGLRSFFVFFEDTISKPLINSIRELHEVLQDIQNYLGPIKKIEMLPDGSIPESNTPTVYSHPKFEKLCEILNEHFTKSINSDTKVMVFCEYRESVMEIYSILLKQKSLVKPRIFLGQGAISQGKQLQTVKQFKSGAFNTLISTCIGEEGLDVGEVDLIICFDINTRSPIRMVQRMGRTGRKRDGRVVVLVTEGREQQLLSECLNQRKQMTNLLESQHIKQYFYDKNPRMVPSDVRPTCNKVHITTKEIIKPKKGAKKNPITKKRSNARITKNVVTQPFSQNSEKDFVSKTQIDIRSMFSKISNSETVVVNSSQMQSQKIIVNTKLDQLIKQLSYYEKRNDNECKICDIFDSRCLCLSPKKSLKPWIKPDISILNSITLESLKSFTKSLSGIEINDIRKVLQFFNLQSVEEIFVNVEDDFENFANISDIFTQSHIEDKSFFDNKENLEISPPLCTQKSLQLKKNYLEKYNAQNTSSNFIKEQCSSKIIKSIGENVKTNKSHKNMNKSNLFSNFHKTAINSTPNYKITSFFEKNKTKNNNLNVSSNSQETARTNENQNKILCTDTQTNSVKKSFDFKFLMATNVKNNETSASKVENNLQFWDDSVFEVYNSDESLFTSDKEENNENEEINKTNNNTNNKTFETSMLSVTKAVELLNDSKFKLVENCDKTIVKTTNEIIDKTNVKTIDKTTDNITTNPEVIDITIDSESEEEFSLLSFTSDRKRKLTKTQTSPKITTQISPKISSSLSKVECSKSSSFEESPIKKPAKKNPVIHILSSDSDDDFEIQTKRKRPNTKNILSCSSKTKKPCLGKSQAATTINNKLTTKKPVCEYVDDMAEIVMDENYVSDSDEATQSELEDSFISNTPTVAETTMTSKYLQSIRSPSIKPGKFKIPAKLPEYNYGEIFSQPDQDENDTYLNDTFCVGKDETVAESGSMSYLEELEIKLEEKNKKQNNKKRKRIITTSDSE